MNRILTITLNPALDISSRVDGVIAGLKLRCAAPRTDPGGGGINVSRVITELGGQSKTFVVVGGATGLQIVDLLQDEGVTVFPISAEGPTRRSLAITDTGTGEQYRFVFPGPKWGDAAEGALIPTLKENVGQGTWVVLSGSFPPGAGVALLQKIASVVDQQGGSLCLDTSGPVLKSILSQPTKLDLLRIDRAEAEDIAGRPFRTPEELAVFARSLLSAGVAKSVLLALAEQGNLCVTRDICVFCTPPKVKIDSAVGAGDSLLGAFVLKAAEGWPFHDALRYGTAAAAATVTTPATALCLAKDVEAYHRQVQAIDL